MTRKRSLTAAIVALLALAFVALALLWTAPADIAYQVLRSRLGGWQALGLSGSLWSGRAEQVALHGMPLGALEWRVSRAAFFGGSTEGNASLRGTGIVLDLDFEKRGPKAVLRNVALTLPAQWLAPAIALPGMVPLGEVAAKLGNIEFTDGFLTGAEGVVEWRGVGVSGAAEGAIGDLEANFGRAADGAVVLNVRDRGARLRVDGSVRFQGPVFELEVKLMPRESNLQLFDVLRLIGQRTPDGGTLLRVRGQMQPLF